MAFNLKGLLQDEEFLLGAGLLSAGSQGKSLGGALMPTLIQSAQIKKLTTPKDTRTNLMKNLESAGFEPGTEEYKQALIASLAKTEAGATGLGLKKSSNIDSAIKAADYSLKGLNFINRINKVRIESPGAFGIAGRFKQFGKDTTTEVQGIYGDATKFVRETGGIDAGSLEFIDDKNFSGIEPLQNALSIIVARSRNPSNRLLKDMISKASNDADLRQLGGEQKAGEKLQFLAAELTDTAIRQLKLAGKSNEEIAAAIKPYENIFTNNETEEINKTQNNNTQKLPRYIYNPKTKKLELVDE